MATETSFSWNIVNMERTLATGIVNVLHYTIDAFNGTYRSSAYGSIGLEPPEEDATIPYGDLTKETVVGWLLDKLGEEKKVEVETALQTQIDEQRAPTKGAGLPWGG